MPKTKGISLRREGKFKKGPRGNFFHRVMFRWNKLVEVGILTILKRHIVRHMVSRFWRQVGLDWFG